MPIVKEQQQQKPNIIEFHPKYTELQRRVVQKVEEKEYHILWYAVLIGTILGVGIAMLAAHFSK